MLFHALWLHLFPGFLVSYEVRLVACYPCSIPGYHGVDRGQAVRDNVPSTNEELLPPGFIAPFQIGHLR